MVKFRGKTKEGKEVKGYYCYVQKKHYIILSGAFISPQNGIHYYSEVIPSTIAQFTGLKDKNKVEIYGSIEIDGKMSEGGDIVKVKSDIPTYQGAVEFNCGSFMIQAEHIAGYRWIDYEIEIIGNQTDDKNLLE